MREITKEEAHRLTEIGTEYIVLINEENRPTESVITLKKNPTGFILGISCGIVNISKFYFSEEFETINQLCQNYVTTLKEKGNPFLDHGMSKQELKELASQLGKPEGEKGIQIGQMMNETNISMTRKTLEQLSLNDNDRILELGHGNANHLIELLNIAANLHYFGIDISELMMQEAEKFCIENIPDKNTEFQLYDGINIPFADNSFDKIFTVNTIYFWQQPVDIMIELNRVLKPNGILCITFVDEDTMNQLTFTEFGFAKYNQSTFKKLTEESKLEVTETKHYSEIIKSKMLEEVDRKYWIMTLTK